MSNTPTALGTCPVSAEARVERRLLPVPDEGTEYLGARRPLVPLEQERLLYGKTPSDDPAFWSRPNNRCLCATCGEVFSGETMFNAHLAPDRNADEYVGLHCLPPNECGQELHPRGYWIDPESAARQRSVFHNPKAGSAPPSVSNSPAGRDVVPEAGDVGKGET